MFLNADVKDGLEITEATILNYFLVTWMEMVVEVIQVVEAI